MIDYGAVASSKRRKRRGAEVASGPTIHFLDMGRERYGDCIVVTEGSRRILIDAGHPRDFEGSDGTPSIPSQISDILGHAAPFNFALLVVTHGHNDHIGCMPRMVEAGILTADFALVADPDFAFPPGARDAVGDLGLSGDIELGALRAAAAVGEEDQSTLDDAELALFLEDALRLGARYRKMITSLEERGTKVLRWGVDPVDGLREIMIAVGMGFDVLGPSVPHLELCRTQIVEDARRAADTIRDLARYDDFASSPSLAAARLYRATRSRMADAGLLSDNGGQGAALNCQSLVITIGSAGNRVLLGGDMQFVDGQVRGLEDELALLRRTTVGAGPYRLVKTPHHTSDNGFDLDFWRDLGEPGFVVHTGGFADSGHPDPSVLRSLSEVSRSFSFARTDRNGCVSIDLARGSDAALSVSRGKLNDFTPNEPKPKRKIDEQIATSPPTGNEAEVIAAEGSVVEVTFVKLPFVAGRIKIDGRVIEIDRPAADEVIGPRRSPSAVVVEKSGGPASRLLGGGRDLSGVVFVTNRSRLAANVGRDEADACLALIRGADADLLLLDDVQDAEEAVRRHLRTRSRKGVVLVGGYDVVPSQRVDVLDAALRASISPRTLKEDQDGFIVWSDDVWGDVEGDGMPNLPVSRAPDGRSAELLLRVLTATDRRTVGKFGLRNIARPFAAGVFALIPGNERLLESSPTHFRDVDAASLKGNCYFMLHGSDRDGSRFWGDDPARGGVVEAINVGRLPSAGLGVALAGCCWGALIVDQKANETTTTVAPKTPERSIALSVLSAGALAFVGCTGVHYSPDAAGGFFGGPMHRAFWRELIENGLPPAEALFEARKNFLSEMPHGRTRPLEVAIERKIYKQFTCLGLGW